MAPVVSAALGALGPLLTKLGGLLAGEYGRLKGVRREIRSLESELISMHAALKEYTELEDPGGQVKAWISLVRELAYDTEDVFDKFIHQLHKGCVRRGGFKEFLGKIALPLKKLGAQRAIADHIDELKDRIKQVKELKDSYKLDNISCSASRHTAVDPRLCALFAEEAHLVGIDGPRDDLAKWMVEEGKMHCRVLSIVGFGGLGKTTLANEVSRKIQGRFDCRAFVSVSQKPVIKKIIKDVISKVPCPDGFTKDIDIWDEMTAITKLRELLQDKRYLVVIDDIWSASAWDAIKYAFPENNCSSRIIFTTRIVDVAKSCCLGRDNRLYEMEALSDFHSRRLFFNRIFGSEDCCSNMLKKVSDEILKKCGGLPLAIISISSLLANIPVAKEEWEKVKRSIGSALENSRSLEGMGSILSLSYNNLPAYLKTCLLYLSAFPEDYEIERERLVRRWIAEGFICEERGKSQYEVAESYFYELINKSMVQPVGFGYDGKVRACRVHDMMLEIIISKSAEDNFMTVLGGGQTSFANRHRFIRRLSIQHIDQELASALANEDLSHVRSLTVTSSGCMKHLPSLAEFEALRVLDFEGCEDLEYDMNGMDKLFQLKYLSLGRTHKSKLPQGIVMLGDLETLDLRGTGVQDLPSGIVRLIKLQHLLVQSGTKIPNGIGDMRNLRVLSGFTITQSRVDAVEDLGSLTSLHELDVYLDGGEPDEYKRHEEMLLSSLFKLGRCKLLTLRINRYGGSLEFLGSWSPPPSSLQLFYMSSNYYFQYVPRWITPALSSLSYININLIELTDEGLHPLGELPSLLRLELWFKARPKDRVTVHGFPCLKEFNISSNHASAYVTFVKGAMPKLEIFGLQFDVSVAKTYGFYVGIEYLTCLKHVRVRLYNNGATPSESKAAAAAAIRNEGAAHPNHPTVTIYGEPVEKDNEETGGNDEDKRKEGN
ncbi:putative disease resistance RPP13-like protein 3 [Brachypodium distachyon]|nr:putative disease resistance RPP13-like protein 3 [Brachypodium distachyon]KQK12069.1 hypothetical protein BRADI_1g01407v3 [Brachypodium distachyon]|eukprot:XP_024313832.1 putative disease resistance RPP13-like protein 3 [Brachypodium distachyon]